MNKPPMGWNSYDYYDTTVNEEEVRANADFMAANLKEFGWEYIVVDIAWYSYESGQQRDKYQYVPFSKIEMDEYGRLLPCLTRFPSSMGGKGFAPLADYVHKKGLKFGIHIMRGIPRAAAYRRTEILGTKLHANDIANPYSICHWNPDMYGVTPDAEGAQEYYNSLLQLYAVWGVDFIKCDDICRMDAESSKAEIEMLHRAIASCGRDIVLSLSPGPALVEESEFYHNNANMWRITDDLWDNWDSLRDMFDRCRNWQGLGHDEGYPDCDMLPLGYIGRGFQQERKSRLTFDEQQTMMTLWCIFRSPLMLGAELTKLDSETLSLLCNKSVLRLLESSSHARETYRDEELIVWQTDNLYLALFNISEEPLSVLPSDHIACTTMSAVELWRQEEVSLNKPCVLPPHGCTLLKVQV